MEILVHIGLNKCASTYIQHALDGARDALCRAGTWYPDQAGPPCQYGLSRAFGFGPDAPGIAGQSPADLIAGARAQGCQRLILSSEYFSLHHPAGARRLVAALDDAYVRTRFVMLSRDVGDWIRAQFNQYVRTVDGGPLFAGIDAWLDQVLTNGALRIAGRFSQWQALLPPGAISHYRLDGSPRAALTPFEAFAGIAIPAPRPGARNASIGADALYRIAVLRQSPPDPARDREIAALLAGAPAPRPAPAGYLTIGADRMARIEREITAPWRELPVDPLPIPPGV